MIRLLRKGPGVEGRNILLIVVDCLRADFVYEDGHALMPRIHALRDGGFCFFNTITATPNTGSSFASLLTGRHTYEHGVRTLSGPKLMEGIPTLPEALQKAGYHTYAEVSGPMGLELGLDRGFEQYDLRARTDTIHGQWGQQFLQKVSAYYESPWFVMLHIWSLHRKRQVLPECRGRRYGRTEYGRALASIDRFLGKLLKVLPEDALIILTGDHGERISSGPIDKLYKKMRTKLYRFMKKRGLTREHACIALRGCHEGHNDSSLSDVLVKVPLVFYWKGRVPVGRSRLQVRHIDLFPTVLELARVEAAADATGETLAGIIRGEPGAHRDAYLGAIGIVRPERDTWLTGVRVDNKYKYVYSPFRDDFPPQLFDLENDPDETVNIADKEPDTASDLRARIDSAKADSPVESELPESVQKVVMDRLRDLGYLD